MDSSSSAGGGVADERDDLDVGVRRADAHGFAMLRGLGGPEQFGEQICRIGRGVDVAESGGAVGMVVARATRSK